MALPNTGMDAVPFTPLTAEFLDDMIENIESLSDGTGFETGAITTNTLADNGVTTDKIDFSTFSSRVSTDANGWRVIDMNAYKIATKRITFNQTINSGSGVGVSISSDNLPVGLANMSSARMSYSYSISNGNAYQTVLVAEMQTTATTLNFTATKIVGGSSNSTGFIDVIIVY